MNGHRPLFIAQLYFGQIKNKIFVFYNVHFRKY